jgi:hypothetical protein
MNVVKLSEFSKIRKNKTNFRLNKEKNHADLLKEAFRVLDQVNKTKY